MRYFIAALLLGLVTIAQAFAQSPLPKEGFCPHGYRTSGKYCIPLRDEARPAIARSGQCPSGYYSNGNYCVANSARPRDAIPKNGMCPNGYYSSGNYCMKLPQVAK